MEANLGDFSLQTGLSMSELLARADPHDPVELLESAGWRGSEHSVPGLCSTYGRSLSLTDSTKSTPSGADRPAQRFRPVPGRLRRGAAAVSESR
ncbi:hypothetical protein [Arthrobacter sp. 24S4-2]|uniref:hypothetical protein n=1 Tax=Arthrobacter sp. 24S4-2 TaxID=2575374 RepID=UPI00158603DA|nr:hypothetical protein [Arthrobacter sp. 24S4-2]